jgi:hypothetical protein
MGKEINSTQTDMYKPYVFGQSSYLITENKTHVVIF